jgi:hypothetical protein
VGDFDDIERFGHGLVLATAIGALVYVIVAALVGWL